MGKVERTLWVSLLYLICAFETMLFSFAMAIERYTAASFCFFLAIVALWATEIGKGNRQ